MRGAIDVKSYGFLRTLSFKRAVRVSSRAARGRRAMILLRCPRKCPGDGSRAGWTTVEKDRTAARVFKHLGERDGALWSKVESARALVGDVLELGTGIEPHPFEHDLVDAAVPRGGDRDPP